MFRECTLRHRSLKTTLTQGRLVRFYRVNFLFFIKFNTRQLLMGKFARDS
jgi:hypothetical protein